MILGNRVGCLFREPRERILGRHPWFLPVARIVEIYETSSVSFYRSILLARPFIEVYASVRARAAACVIASRVSLLLSLFLSRSLAPRARSYAFVAAYVRLRRDMATAREAKHINCRLTPQKQHDLIPRRICKRLAYTSKSHSKATPAARERQKETTESEIDGRSCSEKRNTRVREDGGTQIVHEEKSVLRRK